MRINILCKPRPK